jgi:hypothetical protein
LSLFYFAQQPLAIGLELPQLRNAVVRSRRACFGFARYALGARALFRYALVVYVLR